VRLLLFDIVPFSSVMPGLVPGIHVVQPACLKTWMAGTSPAMTKKQ